MALFSSVSAAASLSVSVQTNRCPLTNSQQRRRFSSIVASLSSAASSPESSPSSTSSNPTVLSSSSNHPHQSFSEPTTGRPHDSSFNNALASPKGNLLLRLIQSAESNIEKVIFDFRFLALLAVGGSLAGSVLCFLNGSVYIIDAYKVYWTSCVKGIHTGQMVLRLVEAIGMVPVNAFQEN
ncbi:hypothetical protein CRG98_016588 [Punica granatum]|uniref:Uncharacterized protein n=1 Tax=Punica granatum TaxID=22663 RepID=A0A2I0K332_PUNGR|nr:hypothetical protein CRG98_016588 [Punica granatum]